jgi:Ca2+/Na+ antiporter
MKFIKKHFVVIINVVLFLVFVGLLVLNYALDNKLEFLTYVALIGLLVQGYFLVRKIMASDGREVKAKEEKSEDKTDEN